MRKDKTLCEQNEKEIEELLLGHKVTVDDYDNLVLDNGVVLQINPNIGCYGCESGNYYLQHISSVNNAITNVEFVEEFEDDCYYEHYRIFVIADGMTTELLDENGEMESMIFIPEKKQEEKQSD